MSYLLIWFLPLSSKNFFLIVNIIDVVLTLSMGVVISRTLAYMSGTYMQSFDILMFVFLILSILSLVVFISKSTYAHTLNRIYVFYRLFLTLIVFIFLVIRLYWIAAYSGEHKFDLLVWFLSYFIFNGLNLYWSLEMLKMVN